MFDQQLHLTLHQAQAARYDRLAIDGQCLPFWVVSHVQDGRVETRTGAEARTAASGTVMVHPPGVPFSENADGPGRHEFLFLDATVGPGIELLRLYPVALTVKLRAPGDWSEAFAGLLRADGAAPGLAAFGLTVQLLSTVIADWQAAGAGPRPASLDTPADRFTGLVHFMEAHLSEPIGRSELAARACLHPGSLNRAFGQAYGIAPMRLLREMRLARARRLLETTDKTLDAVAALCGFEDTAYFSRAFRARYGLPPGSHRRRIREGVKSALQGYSRPLPAAAPGSILEAEHSNAEGNEIHAD